MMGTLRLMRWENMVHLPDDGHPTPHEMGKHGDQSNADMSLPIETILLIIQISMYLNRCENIDNRDENSIY